MGRGLLCHCDPVLDTGVGNLGTVAMVVCRLVLNLNEIATWFDRLTMSGYAPRNDSRPVWFYKVSTREGQGLSVLQELPSPLMGEGEGVR